MRRAGRALSASVAASVFALGSALVVCAAVAACSTSNDASNFVDPGDDGGPSTVRPLVDSSAPDSDAGPFSTFDASGDQPAINTLCAMAKQLGSSCRQVISSAGAHPPFGGVVVPGIYELVTLNGYAAGLDDGGTVSGDDGGGDDSDDDGSDGPGLPTESVGVVLEEKTLVLEADGLFSLAVAMGTVDAGVGASTITAGLYEVSGTNLILHATCPTTSNVTYAFTVAGGDILLYEPTKPITVDTLQMIGPPP